MARWVAFDRDTARSVSYKMDVPVFCVTHAEPLEWAVEAETPTSYLLLPSNGAVLLAKLERPQRTSSSLDQEVDSDLPEADKTPGLDEAGGGFLGLDDDSGNRKPERRVARWRLKL